MPGKSNGGSEKSVFLITNHEYNRNRPVRFCGAGRFCWGLRLGLLFSEHAAFYAGGGEGAVAAEERAVSGLDVRLEFFAAFG